MNRLKNNGNAKMARKGALGFSRTHDGLKERRPERSHGQ